MKVIGIMKTMLIITRRLVFIIKLRSINLFLIIVCLFITSCDIKESNTHNKENQSLNTVDITTEEILEFKEKEVITNNNDILQDDFINYQQYVKKIWVVDEWNGYGYLYPFSFYIIKIENGKIEGKLTTESVAIPDFFYYSLDTPENSGDLVGEINHSLAECQFSDKAGNKGIVTLLFKEEDKIEATIEYTNRGKIYEDSALDGTFFFRPYNLADIDNLLIDEELSFSTKLNSWDDIQFVKGISTGNKPHPVAYLINEKNDIIYQFSAPFPTASKIISVVIEDFNEDELKDIKIITDFPDSPGKVLIEWIFYQMDNGLFYNSKLNVE